MKPSFYRVLGIVLVAIMSVLSFVYINTIDLEELSKGATVSSEDYQDPVEEEGEGIVLPDVEFLRSILRKGKDKLPVLSAF